MSVRGLSDGCGDFLEMRRKELLRGHSTLHDRTRSAGLDEAYVDDAHETEDETSVRNLVIQGSQSRALDVAASAGNNR